MVINKSTEAGLVVEKLPHLPTNDNFNKNVLIVGASGSGKSYLSAILKEERKPKITIIFKEDKTYENNKILRISDLRIPPEVDKGSFITSFQEALNINQMGIMASSLPSVLSQFYGTEREMKRSLKMSIRKEKGLEGEIERFVLSQMELYYPETQTKKLGKIDKRTRGTILSLDSMSQQEQIFFSDYILRILQRTISGDGVLIDEIHRLKNLNATIISEIVREIRHRGYIIAVTQSLSDLPDDLINNFGTIFHFNSIHFTDLEKLKIIDEELPSTIINLRPHQFIEVRRFKSEWNKKFKYIYEVVND